MRFSVVPEIHDVLDHHDRASGEARLRVVEEADLAARHHSRAVAGGHQEVHLEW